MINSLRDRRSGLIEVRDVLIQNSGSRSPRHTWFPRVLSPHTGKHLKSFLEPSPHEKATYIFTHLPLLTPTLCRHSTFGPLITKVSLPTQVYDSLVTQTRPSHPRLRQPYLPPP